MMNQPSGFSGLAKVAPSIVNNYNSTQAKVLIVDDHRFSRMSAVDFLSLEGYDISEADSTVKLLDLVIEDQPDLVLLDVMMPQVDGFEVCKYLKQDKRTNQIPIILVTVAEDRQSRLKCIDAGGDDLMIKPLDRVTLVAKVKSLIAQKRLNEGLDQTEQVLFEIAKAIKRRYSSDSDSSCVRLPCLAQAFGKYLQLSSQEISDLVFAARLHDIGTIAIPDAVLLKKGELTQDERELINQHVLVGEKICQPMQNRSGVLPIIRHHHERWDGSGYPDGLAGSEIPKLAQVFQILDIYDAITSSRPHKQALSPIEALEIIGEETLKGWRNPQLSEHFTNFIIATENLDINQKIKSA